MKNIKKHNYFLKLYFDGLVLQGGGVRLLRPAGEDLQAAREPWTGPPSNYEGRKIKSTVSAEMSSWTALTWNIVIKTAFQTKNMKIKNIGNFIIKILNFESD